MTDNRDLSRSEYGTGRGGDAVLPNGFSRPLTAQERERIERMAQIRDQTPSQVDSRYK